MSLRLPWDLGVYVILGGSSLDAMCGTMRACALAGVEVFQLRMKDVSVAEIRESGRELVKLARELNVALILNDDVLLAKELGTHGVHLGPEDMPVADARRLAPDLIIGASAGSVHRALELESAGADYLGCGAIYDARPSKSNASMPRGPELLTEVVQAVSIPVVGIGGITHENVAEVIRAGARGAAVIRAVGQGEGVKDRALELVEAVRLARLELMNKV